MVGCTGAFTILKEPVMALTDGLVAIVIKISLLVLKCCSMSQLFAMRFAFNSSSRVMPPFTAAAAMTDIPPVRIAAIGTSASDEFFASWRVSTVLMLFLHSRVS